jgi:DNA-binding NtrC family response regulator
MDTISNKRQIFPLTILPPMDTPTQNLPLVLVVDDEAAIREAVRDILELADIESILASNGREAIDLFLQNRARIRAILLDVRMPVLNGNETYTILREIDANVHIILSSGYDEKATALTNDTADAALRFLRKPYALDALLSCVKDALN